MALFRFSGNSGQIPLELWTSWRQEEENLSSVTWCLPSRRLRSAICCQILSSNRRIYLRLPLLTQLDMQQGMCPYIKDHSLGLPRRLGRLRGGPSLRLRHPGDALNLRLLLLRRSALKPPLLRAFYAPEVVARSPEGVFGGRSLSSLCGPVGLGRGAPSFLSTLNTYIASQPFHMDRFPVGGVSYQFRVLCFGLTTAPHVFTWLMAPISAILHCYGVRMLRYLVDWLILAESRTTCL